MGAPTMGERASAEDADEFSVALKGTENRQTRWAVASFVIVEIIGFVFYVLAGRRVWFHRDDWLLLASRHLSVSDLLQQYGGHWIALPLLVFRFLFWATGLRSYLPYQALTIGLHLTAAALLRTIMRRSGVGPWIATAGASVFVLFGSGSTDILTAFQITFDAALVLGLSQLLLADHDGPLNRRDLLGVACGLAALMCSNVAVALVVGVGVAAFMRRGWRVAAIHTLPLGVVYAGWWVSHGRVTLLPKDKTAVLDWTRTGTAGVFNAVGQLPGVGWVLAAMLLAGFVLAWRQLDGTDRRQRFAMPLGLLVAGLVVLMSSGIARVGIEGVSGAKASRYTHVLAAMLLPALAFAANGWVRAQRKLGLVVVALLLVGIPGNLAKTTENFPPGPFRGDKETMLSLPRMSLAPDVPRSLIPDPNQSPSVTVGWLLDGVRSGRLPPPRRPTPRELATNTLRLSLEELDRAASQPCTPLLRPAIRQIRPGETIGVHGTIRVQLMSQAGAGSDILTFGATFLAGLSDHTLVDVAEPLTLRVIPVPGHFGPFVVPPKLCGA